MLGLSILQQNGWVSVAVVPIGASLDFDGVKYRDLCPKCAALITAAEEGK
jgi:hypothetical protein